MMRLLPAVVLFAACNQEPPPVRHGETTDYNHGGLVAAVDKFVAAGRTPEAYGVLASTVSALRPSMDHSVAEEAELKLVVLALAPLKSVQAKPIPEQAEAVAIAVWPTLLAPAIEADSLIMTRDEKAAQLVPKPSEQVPAYLERLCGGPLSAECKHVVPELQAAVVDALAIHRATERVRNAVSDCLMCNADPGWHEAVAAWEELDRGAESWINDVERRADPDNWPMAGAAADDDPSLPEAEVTSHGELIVGGHSYGPNQQRLDVLREVRGTGDAITLHVRPEMTLAQLRAMLIDARTAGCKRVALVTRESVYPWRRKAYWVADGSGLRANLRPSDSVQLLLHAVDEVSGPGTVARVD
jgi:hypothetical protein